MALACIAVVFASNTEVLYRFEHSRFPPLWAFAGITIIAFLAAEYCLLAESPQSEPEENRVAPGRRRHDASQRAEVENSGVSVVTR